VNTLRGDIIEISFSSSYELFLFSLKAGSAHGVGGGGGPGGGGVVEC
jgi:hypothetical protein